MEKVCYTSRVRLTDCPGSTLMTCVVFESLPHLAAVMEYVPGTVFTCIEGVLESYKRDIR